MNISIAEADRATRAWRAMTEIAMSHDRKVEVAEALGMSWTRVLALRALAAEALTLRGIAARLTADPPYVTLMVDDLEARGLVRRRPHPDDRRAKLVDLTRSGRAAAARAERMLGEPPASLRRLSPADLDELLRLLELVRAQ